MSDFCRQCSIELLGEDYKDLAGLSTERDTALGLYAQVFCEGCGMIQVDHDGACVSPHCTKHGGTDK